jgi:mannose-6-phosphate isomerase-like protein (cupin superfamily)
MTLITAEQSPRFEPDPLTRIDGLASPTRGGVHDTAVWRVHLQPGASTPVHTLTREEVFVAVAGRAVASLGTETHEVAAGDALVVPPGVDFRIATTGETAFEAVCCLPVGGQAELDGRRFTPPWAE